ncbi:MAG: hypothetical protein AB1546_08090, partial [bacterium]
MKILFFKSLSVTCRLLSAIFPDYWLLVAGYYRSVWFRLRQVSVFILPILLFSAFTSAAVCAEPLSHPNLKEAQRLDETSCKDGFSFVVMGDNHVDREVFEVLRDIAREMKP